MRCEMNVSTDIAETLASAGLPGAGVHDAACGTI